MNRSECIMYMFGNIAMKYIIYNIVNQNRATKKYNKFLSLLKCELNV